MRCDEFERRMQLLLDARAVPGNAADLKAHAETCDACRRRLVVESRVFDVLEEAHTESVPPDFATRVVAAYLDHRPQPPSRVRARVIRWLSLSAAAGLACLAWFHRPSASPPVPLKAPVSSKTPSRPTQVAVSPARRPPTPVFDPAVVARQLRTAAETRLPDVDDVAVTVASFSTPWAKPITTAFAAIQQNLSRPAADGRSGNSSPGRAKGSSREIVPN